MYQFFIGCDISKLFFDISYFDEGPKYLGGFSNDSEGFKMMVESLGKKTDILETSWFVCLENTGVYSKAMVEWLISRQISCREENPLKIARSIGIKRGKSDKADSKSICRYAFEKRDSIKPTKLSSPLIINLKKLLSRREFLVKQKQALSLTLKEQKAQLDPDLRELMEAQNKELAKVYKRQINEIEKQIEQTIGEEDSLKKNDELAQSITGIGPVISAYLIAFTENYTCFTDARKFASYCGVAPFVHNQSGNKQGKSRVSHMANKKIKSLLSMGASASVMYDKEIRLYYLRKLKESKEKGVVLNAVKNKLLQRVFAIIKRQTPYVKLMNYA
jgi:transposase